MPVIGACCHELRIEDVDNIWRVIYRIDPETILVVDVFDKKTEKTPRRVIAVCKERLALYDSEQGRIS